MFKDITLSARQIRREIVILLICFAVAMATNIFAIIKYGTPWYEVFTQMGFVLIITAVLFILCIAVRILVWLVKLLVLKCRG